jgi:hypothetical protein
VSGWHYRDLVNEGIDPDDYEDPSKDTESYKCANPDCEEFGEAWAVGGWYPPDYHFPDDPGPYANVFCVEYAQDVFCEWCDVQGVRR